MKKIILLSTAITILSSCEKKEKPVAEKTNKLAEAEWLLGRWGNASPEGYMSENWTKINDSVMNGTSYFIVYKKDTVFAETIALTSNNGKLAYTVTVPGQNAEKPVRFDINSATEKQLVFENPAHDFPKKIVYNKINNDSLVAEISGMQKGKPASQQFPMERIK